MKINKKYSRIKKAFLLIIFLLIGLNINSISPKADVVEKNVLIINSYYSGYDWTDGVCQGIYSTLNDNNIVKYVEFMDWKRDATDGNLNNFYDYCKYKYEGKKIDLIITSDDAALKFALKHRKELFSNASIVFGGIDINSVNTILKDVPNVTGVLEGINPEGTVKEALQILPEIKDVYIVHDNTETGISYYNLVTKYVDDNNININIKDLGNYSIDEICEITSKLKDDSVVLLDVYSTEYNGFSLPLKKISNMITERSAVPVFTTSEALIGEGCIGGRILSPRFHGIEMGEMAVRVLNGEDINAIPIQNKDSVKSIYDYRILEKYNLVSAVLPENSIVVNKPFSVYETYKIPIYIIITIFIILVISVAYLMINIKKRIKAEKILLDNNEQINALNEELIASEESLQLNYKELNNKQDELVESEEKYRLVAEASSDIIWEEDVQNNSRKFSHKLFDILGYSDDELITFEDWYNIVHPMDSKYVYKTHRRLTNGDINSDDIEYRVRCKNGQYKWILSNSKPQYDARGNIVKIYGSYKDITELKETQIEINNLAYFDSITKLPNRVSLYKILRNYISLAKEFTLLFVDLDNFKMVNDSYGHAVGDKLLQLVTERLNPMNKKEIKAFRLGGDEFIIIYSGENDKETIEYVANKLLLEISEPYRIEGKFFYISASIGIASYPENGHDLNELLKNADTAMYKSKQSGKNKFTFFDEVMSEENLNKINMHSNLVNAIKGEEFVVYYQPITEVKTGKIVGMEALIRWLSPKQGLIPPDKFIKAAEESGQIIEIGNFVMKNACSFINELKNKGYDNIYVSVNVSAVQLMQNNYKDTLFKIIDEAKISPESLVLEITETVFMESFEEMTKLFSEIRKKGVKIALDDFGSGYSSLSYLKHLPMDLIKIDKSFIDDILSKDENNCIVGNIISIMKQFDFKVIAEGIETEKQLDYINNNKCDYFQGYLVSKPITKNEILKFLE